LRLAVGADKAVILQTERIGFALGKAEVEDLFALDLRNLTPNLLQPASDLQVGHSPQPKTTITFSGETISSTTRMVGTAWAWSLPGAIHRPCQLPKKALISAGDWGLA
jgi:hypothetical protein